MPARLEHLTGTETLNGEKGEASNFGRAGSRAKQIVTLQVCGQCGRLFQPQRGRTRCPSCEGLLRSKTIVIQAP